MTLYSYLKRFKNICWYPSAFKDALSMVALSHKSLSSYGIQKEDCPDCFIFTDYDSHLEGGNFFLDVDELTDEVEFNYEGTDYSATAFNIKELNRLKIDFDQEMVEFECDINYGRVFVMDILIDHHKIGKTIAKLVYIIVENTKFAFDFLLKKNIKISYIVHSRYGHGFGGGISNGCFLCNILKDLETKYIACDFNEYYQGDVADRYLTDEQRNTIPVLRKIDDFAYRLDWAGYDHTVLYEVVGFSTPQTGLFVSPKFQIER